MIDIEDKGHRPSFDEIRAFVGNPLFDRLYDDLTRAYAPLIKIEYSGDKVLLGWNVKYRKAGRTLCTVYPRRGYFPMLLIVGRREKERVEALLPSLSDAFQAAYHGTQEGMGQRWMLLEFRARTPLYDDALQIIRIRRQSKQAVIVEGM